MRAALRDKADRVRHPICGQSWEGFVIENCVGTAPIGTEASFYRSSAGAECDLLLTFSDQTTWAIEIKRSSAPRLQKGFYFALDDVQPEASFLIYPGQETFPLNESTKAIGLLGLLGRIAEKH